LPKRSTLSSAYRVTGPRGFRLTKVDPADTGGVAREEAEKGLRAGVLAMRKLQEKLYAQDRWGVLLIFQALDAAGKDSTIKHVLSGVNPQGCQVFSFKAPSSEELDHDFLWRTSRRLPERGRIGIFNRSYYEEVLVVRVHPELLARQRLPQRLVTGRIFKERFEDIRNFERYATRNGIAIVKFLLHVSREEQRERLLARIDDPAKHWKASADDIDKRRHWDEYQAAYDSMVRHTAAPYAPWYVVPADHKWFTRLVVADAIVRTLEGLKLAYPRVTKAERRALQAARKALEES